MEVSNNLLFEQGQRVRRVPLHEVLIQCHYQLRKHAAEVRSNAGHITKTQRRRKIIGSGDNLCQGVKIIAESTRSGGNYAFVDLITQRTCIASQFSIVVRRPKTRVDDIRQSRPLIFVIAIAIEKLKDIAAD